ncbi:tetratricopeptide-like helical domain-containing protein [Artemisia annua]|uniref:Tetratricopeptide-like helical domain-containing protein n=1 Tax=Artemisia annua TaxID=35608 RepID=A0A2U1NX98_ARTAN|nr:tetratricopeptide-like helical domain-containing protein [Artemisia annua]
MSFSQVIDIVKNSNKHSDIRSKLDKVDGNLTKRSVSEVFKVLSCEKVLAVEFFDWVGANNKEMCGNVDICSLMIDNCGWVGDYETMKVLLQRFKDEVICLNDKAFGFLHVVGVSKARGRECVEMVVRVLSEVGGSVRNSGVFELVKMLGGIDEFELAKFVIEITERKLSYYGVLVRDMCRRGRLDEARGLIGEMRVAGCEPDTKIYNYVLSGLCKREMISEAMSLAEEMKEKGVEPDEITFEIFITNSCRAGKMELVNESLERLISTGRPPRLSTYVAIVKGYFNAGRYDEAYKFVHDMEGKKMPAINKMYSLLARLHQRKGNVKGASSIFDEMMRKGLKPDFSSYEKTVNVLRNTGGKDIARDLKEKYSKFRIE